MSEPLICSQGGIPYNKAHLDAKDARIGALEAEIGRLRAAALPFAQHDWMDADLEDDNCKLTRGSGPITVGHWRVLRRALEGKDASQR
jgi:hypothetical protein